MTPNAPSIGNRLKKGIVIALTASSAITFGVLYGVGRAERISTFERALQDDMRTIASITQVQPNGELYVNADPKLLTDYLAGGHRFFQTWDANAQYLADKSPSLDALAFRFPRPTPATPKPKRFEAQLPDGRQISFIWQRVNAQGAISPDVLQSVGIQISDREVELLVGRLRSELDDSLRPLLLACIAGALLLPLIAAALLAYLLPRALRPLRDLTQAIALREPNDTQPFQAHSTHEVQLITERLNGLLERISGVRLRERNFMVDTAHELRTPLAELQVVADVALISPGDAHQQKQTLHQIRDVTHRMARLVDALFRLSRRNRNLEVSSVNLCLASVLQAAVDAAQQPSQQRHLNWVLTVPPDAKVTADPVLLRALLDNLIGNIVAHASAHTDVKIVWFEGEKKMGLDLRNQFDPQELTPDHLHRMGHGLSIANLYAQALALQLHTQRNAPFFEVTLTFDKPTPSIG
jgi:signal transduction histidine kinase